MKKSRIISTGMAILVSVSAFTFPAFAAPNKNASSPACSTGKTVETAMSEKVYTRKIYGPIAAQEGKLEDISPNTKRLDGRQVICDGTGTGNGGGICDGTGKGIGDGVCDGTGIGSSGRPNDGAGTETGENQNKRAYDGTGNNAANGGGQKRNSPANNTGNNNGGGKRLKDGSCIN